MGKKADSNNLGYGLSKSTRGYFVKVPLLKGELTNTFKSLQKAKNWQIAQARKEWGLERFSIIKRGRLAILRKFGCGVSVRQVKSSTLLVSGRTGEYLQYGVFWREHDGKKKSVYFSQKRYGEHAEIEAHWFASQQRARLTDSELHLPKELTPYSFDLEASVAINTKQK